MLVAVGTLWPRARTVALVYALAIAASRIIVTAHYPTDVLAGAIVGTVGALMVRRWFALRRLGFSIGPDGLTASLSWTVAQADQSGCPRPAGPLGIPESGACQP